MARMDNVAITARMMAIALLAPGFARTAMLELPAVLDWPVALAGFKSRAGVRGVVHRGAADEWGGDSRRTW